MEKEAVRERVRTRITAEIDPIVDAAIARARGICYLVVRDKQTGKFIRVSEAMAKEKSRLKRNEEIIEVWEKEPDISSIRELLDRAIDKPKEQQLDVKVEGDFEKFVARINKARQKMAEDKRKKGR